MSAEKYSILLAALNIAGRRHLDTYQGVRPADIPLYRLLGESTGPPLPDDGECRGNWCVSDSSEKLGTTLAQALELLSLNTPGTSPWAPEKR
jgi:hypothetical protein